MAHGSHVMSDFAQHDIYIDVGKFPLILSPLMRTPLFCQLSALMVNYLQFINCKGYLTFCLFILILEYLCPYRNSFEMWTLIMDYDSGYSRPQTDIKKKHYKQKNISNVVLILKLCRLPLPSHIDKQSWKATFAGHLCSSVLALFIIIKLSFSLEDVIRIVSST